MSFDPNVLSWRTVHSFAPLLTVQALVALGFARGWSGTAWRETTGLLWASAIGACIALIGQTYHLSGNTEAFLLSWVILVLPVVWLTRAVSVLAVYLALALAWASFDKLDDGVALLFWPLAAAALPGVGAAVRQNPYGQRAVLMLWAVALACTAAIGITLEKIMPGLWMVVYAGLFATLYLSGGYWGAEAPTFWQRPLHTIGSFGTVVLVYLLTFDWPWHEVGWQYARNGAGFHPGAALFDDVLALVLPLAALVLLATAVRRRQSCRIPFGLLPLVIAAGYLTAAAHGWNAHIPFLLCNGYLLALGIAVLIQGIRTGRAGTVNAGMLIVMGLILTRFFDSDYSFVAKGVVFIVLGSLFLGANLLLARRRKEGAA